MRPLFELRQMESLFWYAENILRIAQKLPLIPMPNYQTEQNSILNEEEIISRIEQIKGSLSRLTKHTAFYTRIQNECSFLEIEQIDLNFQKIDAIVAVVDRAIAERGRILSISSSTYLLNQEEVMPPLTITEFTSSYSIQAHRNIYHHALQAEAFEWMCCLDACLSHGNLGELLPEPPQPVGAPSGNLYDYNDQICASISQRTMRALHERTTYMVSTYGLEVLFPCLVDNIRMLDEDVQERMEERRRNKGD
ncbi:hypothetical protein JA33_041 [Dickeya phage vB_DsoM_JA33]|uniref:Uncharacterized protein n=3 Tax=Salmondvirus JA11 TaxID=2734141 RepID=A0A384ZW41_9CAUD|nr:hypothetical protein HOU32_gp041 [Dickeya phage vB_DsoM_JA11]AXG66446.1 hypothetical protein JA13_043 [Dickeya phage vB_DsoM_JA13]AXG67415.1 hypothetical protein JA33_041 [Dickeya phage vB_DsoM_JA33]AYD79846.1 hypothetical protein JA11_041 [Dickeya phage vB_DsoM_JA11]